MRMIGYRDGSPDPRHGTLIEDMLYMAECTLATVEILESRTRPPKGELERQRRLAKYAISSAIFHGADNQAKGQKLVRSQELLDRYYKTGKLVMHWEEGE